jgi:hypothetical protein
VEDDSSLLPLAHHALRARASHTSDLVADTAHQTPVHLAHKALDTPEVDANTVEDVGVAPPTMEGTPNFVKVAGAEEIIFLA